MKTSWWMVTGLFIQGLMVGPMLLSILINNPNNIMGCTFTMVQSANVLGQSCQSDGPQQAAEMG